MVRSGRIVVGNDVVDLRDEEATGKSRDERFVRRILTETERREFEAAPTDEGLWRRWAAKEAAYKAIAKRFGASPTPRALGVRWDTIGHRASTDGHIEWRGHSVAVRWEVDADKVHCVAWIATPTALERVDEFDEECRISTAAERADAPRLRSASLTPREAVSARNESSAAVRQLARELIVRRTQDVDGSRSIEFVRERGTQRGFGPPRVVIDGRYSAAWDVSLSHHGRFVAAAVCPGWS